MASENFRCFLKTRPGANSDPNPENFGYESCTLPAAPQEGEITIKTLYLSLDPALRCRMNDDTGVQYMAAWQLGETVLGLGGVGMVTMSHHNGYTVGDIVHSMMNWPWCTMFNTRTDDPMFPVSKVDEALHKNPQTVLSIFGMTGLTAYLGVQERGHVVHKCNQTFVVSGAAGACGNLAGQIARLLGALNVVGICGSDAKCAYLTSQLGFTSAINYKTENVADRLSETCPSRIWAYFDNVGGAISEEVIKHMTYNSHIILCGQIAVYNKDVPYPPPVSQECQDRMEALNITRERFLVLDYIDKSETALKQLQEWYITGKLKVPEYIHEGLENATTSFVNMMTSVNQDKVGKQMVHVSS